MEKTPEVFLDTSAVVAGIWSEEGGSRELLRLGASDVIQIVISERVTDELEQVLRRKDPELLANMTLLLDRADVEVCVDPDPEDLPDFLDELKVPGDREIAGAALEREVNYFVTFDRADLLENELLEQIYPIPIGTAGDCLKWLRDRWLNTENR